MRALINCVCLINDDGTSDTWRVSDICSGGTCAMECVWYIVMGCVVVVVVVVVSVALKAYK